MPYYIARTCVLFGNIKIYLIVSYTGDQFISERFMEVEYMSTDSLEDVGTCCLPCLGRSSPSLHRVQQIYTCDYNKFLIIHCSLLHVPIDLRILYVQR
jgi:hypothetical protein